MSCRVVRPESASRAGGVRCAAGRGPRAGRRAGSASPRALSPRPESAAAAAMEMEHFIETVRKYPCLWNTAAIEYRDQELKDAAWAEVMKETDLSSGESGLRADMSSLHSCPLRPAESTARRPPSSPPPHPSPRRPLLLVSPPTLRPR